jgi:hypothetical protein
LKHENNVQHDESIVCNDEGWEDEDGSIYYTPMARNMSV